MAGGEHSFGRKTFHKPTYCHHCSDLLWGLIGQGYICEVCNFIVHEKCVTNVITPCLGVAPYLIRNPVAHCWSEPSQHKRKFCSVCRKRLDETPAVHCLICEYFAHVECQDFAIPDCKENATYVPGKELGHVKHQHHWREGNLPQSSKCAYCKKACWSYECLTGYRCEWCGTTTHGGCRNNISSECTFGTLQPIYLPPHAVSIPRTEVPMEAIIGVQNKNRGTPGMQRDYSCPELWALGQEYFEPSAASVPSNGDEEEEHQMGMSCNSRYHKLPVFTFYDDCDADSGSSQRLFPSDNDLLLRAMDYSTFHGKQQHHHQFKSLPTRNLIHPAMRRTQLVPKDTVMRSKSFQDQSDSIPKRLKMIPKARFFLRAKDRPKKRSPLCSNNNHDSNASSLCPSTVFLMLKTSSPLTSESASVTASAITFKSDDDGGGGGGTNGSGDACWYDTTIANGQQEAPPSSAEREVVVSGQSVASSPLPDLRRDGARRVLSYSDVSNFVFIDEDIAAMDHRKEVSGDVMPPCSDEEFLPGGGGRGAVAPIDETGNSNKLNVQNPASKIMAAGSGGDDKENRRSHLLGRIYRRMRKCSMGWSKTGCRASRARSISEEISDNARCDDVPKAESSSGTHSKPDSAHKSDKDKDKKDKEKEERDEETIKVFDGNCSYRRRIFRAITVPRTCSLEQLLTTALRAFHIARDSNLFFLTDLYGEEVRLQDPTPVLNLHRVEGKRPAIYLRFRDRENDHGFVRVYPGKLQVENAYVNIPVDNDTTVKDLIGESLKKFGLQRHQIEDYRCSEILLDRGVTERVLSWNERPWEIMKQLGKDSIRQMEMMRFYLQLKQDPHGPNLALFVGNLPPGLSQRNYEHILTEFLGFENKFSSIGPIYYEYGSLVITYENASKAVRAFQALRESKYEEKHLLVLLLPNIEPSMVPQGVQPLLVFVNVKSGGCQGLELISSFRKLLNPYQVFDLDNGGPLPGLYVFRHIQDYKILVCGGDGTIGWVLQCLDNVGQDSECSSPPCAIVPLGTGNDLARVLRWGAGYTGGEDPLNLLRDVIDAEEIRLDRWTVVFHPEDKPEDAAPKPPTNSAVVGASQSEDNSQIFVMNNYFGIGIDADLCLDFHNAREENPNKFNSRLHNKGVYVKMGLRKMVGRKMVKELHKELRLEVDGRVVDLPPVEGIIILNILSWGSGANPWGPEKEDQFSKPNHWDGMLEVVGVTGVVHLGQIQSGLRSAMRIAQGGHIKIHLHSDIPVQVDGEPWVQSPGDVVVLKSALKATMLKKMKGKMKRRNTEPTMQVMGSSGIQMTLAAPQEPEEVDSNNTDF
ncbi:diacylglycerol kinase theta isoform X2 [Toxorhynchites rutilus septentrionalis]|uniref:diacylglycerol kinase theta isoform X2 n=1 Tax=Toxorhynchites rutilus septentrionalis TaxID=329112 RepID=UPI002478B6B8|nr:diacylglycerol kinase theta isoform X2 [Toxorhynchites rutilus septentrionalis]